MVESENFALEKYKAQELPLECNTLSDTFQQNTTNEETPPEFPQIHGVDPNIKFEPHFKKQCSFRY